MQNISVRNEAGQPTKLDLVEAALAKVFELHPSSGDVDVVVTTDEEMRELNRLHRDIDEATDVLTFPGPDWPGAPLGDIALSYNFALKGAVARGVEVEEELAYLAIHGGLHLLGWDDERDEDRDAMVVEMNRIALAAGLRPDPDWASQPHGDSR